MLLKPNFNQQKSENSKKPDITPTDFKVRIKPFRGTNLYIPAEVPVFY